MLYHIHVQNEVEGNSVLIYRSLFFHITLCQVVLFTTKLYYLQIHITLCQVVLFTIVTGIYQSQLRNVCIAKVMQKYWWHT